MAIMKISASFPSWDGCPWLNLDWIPTGFQPIDHDDDGDDDDSGDADDDYDDDDVDDDDDDTRFNHFCMKRNLLIARASIPIS